MFKKIVAWALLIALTATAAVGGTLAYLTDRDSEANVFTIGNVSIDLEEDFEQGAELIPGVNIEKKPVITNTGVNDAWVWLEFAIPSALDNWATDTQVGSNENVIHWNQLGATTEGYVTAERVAKAITDGHLPEGTTAEGIIADNSTWNLGGKEAFSRQAEINGVMYNIYVIGYNKALESGETTLPNIYKVFLDAQVDIDPNGDWYKVDNGNTTKIDWNTENGNPVIYVSAYAMQVEGFATVDEAIAAYNEQWGDNGTEYADPEDIGAEGEPAPENAAAMYNGTEYPTIYEAVAAANANSGGTINLLGSAKLDKPVEIASDITINGATSRAISSLTRAEGYTGTMFTVKAGATLNTESLILDGAGATATGNLVAAEANANIVLNAGTVLKNNNGALAVNLGTRIGATLTLNGAHIINNSSDAGAIWGGGNITINEGSKISNNSSTGVAGAIRMVSNCNLTMNGGEISNNTAASSGGAIYGYGSSTYNFNGGVMSNNKAAAGGAMYTGDSSVINISGTFEMTGNEADDAGAMRLSNRTTFNMTGGTISGNTSKNTPNWEGFYGWNPAVNISDGNLVDDIYIEGGLTPTVGGSGITGVVHFAVSTTHNTVNLAANFGTIKFTVAEGSNFAAFNFKPAADYTYAEGNEAKLVCMNEGYETYWTGTVFKIRAK